MNQPIVATAATGYFVFYDVESLHNVFTLSAWDPRTKRVDVFFLVDPSDTELHRSVNDGALDTKALTETIFEANPALDRQATIQFHNLRTFAGNMPLARAMGLSDSSSVCNPAAPSGFGHVFRPVCDVDPGYDPINLHPYLAGYNSHNYDTSMLALYFTEALGYITHTGLGRAQTQQELTAAGKDVEARFMPITAAAMRRHSDRLFTEEHTQYMPSYLTKASIEGFESGWESLPNRIRNAMLSSGRHFDVAALNEIQRRVGLKRLLGGLGRQILESQNLKHNSTLTTQQEFFNLVAYNVSDVVGLAHLFEHPTYASAFDLKNGLLNEYPETRYEKSKFDYSANIDPRAVRRNRLAVDSTSAKFVARILAPYSNLEDLKTVSFMYPSQEVADELGIERRDVLDECRAFLHANLTQDNEATRRAKDEFEEVYKYYDQIRDKNFNDSPEYYELYSVEVVRPDTPGGSTVEMGEGTGRSTSAQAPTKELPQELEPITFGHITNRKLNIPYYHSDGSPSTCFVTFSTGGIHGAEADWDAWHAEVEQWQAWDQAIADAKAAYPDPRDLAIACKEEHNRIRLPDGTFVDKSLVLLGSDPEKVSWRRPKKEDPNQCEQLARAQAHFEHAADLLARQRPADQESLCTLPDGITIVDIKKVLSNTSMKSATYREGPTGRQPELFEELGDGRNKLRPKYTHTSLGPAIHEDFASYYPNMLRNMRAFYNPDLGGDRYAKILADKDHYAAMMKAPGISAAERERLGVLRNGTKLILNSASGAGDTTFANQPIRVNNAIISMRLIGQLFSWRIGQAQTFAGARIVSTNTDGLYSTLDEETNNQVLAEQQALIHVDIEPEPLIIVSKDSNNRLEMLPPKPGEQPWEAKILGGSGSSLACLKGPRPDKSLAHPAIRDYALARYLRYVAGGYTPPWRTEPLSISEPLDRRLGMQILVQALREEGPVFAARLFQNVIAASNAKITIPFASDPLDPQDPDLSPEKITGARALQHYNRVFYVHAGKPGAVSLRSAGTWTVNALSKAKRKAEGALSIVTEDVAREILEANGYTRSRKRARDEGLELLPADQDVQVRRISQIDPAWNALIINEDLHCMDPRTLADLLGCLDMNVYVGLLADVYEKNWMNASEQSQEISDDDED